MANNVGLLAIALCLFVVFVSADYGSHVVSFPGGGGKGKWNIKAKGKGMQNLIHHGGGGGGGHHKEYHHKGHETVYYPIPVHKEEHHGYGSHRNDVVMYPPMYRGGFGDRIASDFGSYGGYPPVGSFGGYPPARSFEGFGGFGGYDHYPGAYY